MQNSLYQAMFWRDFTEVTVTITCFLGVETINRAKLNEVELKMVGIICP